MAVEFFRNIYDNRIYPMRDRELVHNDGYEDSPLKRGYRFMGESGVEKFMSTYFFKDCMFVNCMADYFKKSIGISRMYFEGNKRFILSIYKGKFFKETYSLQNDFDTIEPLEEAVAMQQFKDDEDFQSLKDRGILQEFINWQLTGKFK